MVIVSILGLVCIVLSIFYWILIEWMGVHWKKTAAFSCKSVIPQIGISVVVVARNEEQQIQSCLRSIRSNSYPEDLFEIILVDDHSEDRTVEYARNLKIPNLIIVNLADEKLDGFGSAYKKAGQYYGVRAARFNHILLTDADCVVPENWISSYSQLFDSSRLQLITSEIRGDGDAEWIRQFQNYDLMVNMAATNAGIRSGRYYLANGGNMGFDKTVYLKYSEEMDVSRASGDDVSLIQWVAQQNKNIAFIHGRHVRVTTSVEDSLLDLIRQRIRWGTKTFSYRNRTLTYLIFCVGLFHVLLWVMLILGILGYPAFFLGVVVVLMVKIIADIRLFNALDYSAGFNSSLVYLVGLSLFQSLFFMMIGILCLFVKEYDWKGRRVH